MGTRIFNPNNQRMESKKILEPFNAFQTLQSIGIVFAKVLNNEPIVFTVKMNEEGNSTKEAAI